MGQIFVSYSRKDRECVDLVTAQLEAQDFPLWRDTDKLGLTANWVSDILDALEKTDMYLLFWSANARDSKFVNKEMEIAQKRYFSSSLKYVLTIMLDDTPLPDWLSHLQAANFRGGCDIVAIAQLVRGMPEGLRVYNPKKTLRDQVHSSVEGTPFLSVLFRRHVIDEKRVLRASIIGPANAVITKPVRELRVCLQFTGVSNKNHPLDVYQTLKQSDLSILHIQGPLNADGSRYEVDNMDPALWETINKFIVESIAAFAAPETTRLAFFTLTPNALLGRLALSYWRFWEIEFYNYAPETGVPYQRVYHVLRNSL